MTRYSRRSGCRTACHLATIRGPFPMRCLRHPGCRSVGDPESERVGRREVPAPARPSVIRDDAVQVGSRAAIRRVAREIRP